MGDTKKPGFDGDHRGAGPVETGCHTLSCFGKSVKSIQAEVRRQNKYFDRRKFQGAYYWERGFLSCAMAGGGIPAAITPDHFRMPFNRIIFKALHTMHCSQGAGFEKGKCGLLIALLKATGNFEKAGRDAHLEEIRGIIGIPSAVRAFGAKLVELKAGVAV
ncbi:MAG: hypothetical protein LBU85_12975 [Treponema sp.]|jgi:hypothetical protein|nr:hypothetical protein [Treponema sp.]